MMSTKIYFIPGMQPSTGGLGEGPSFDRVEMARRAHPEFFAERDQRRGADRFASGFTPGDEVTFQGQPAMVEHVEWDQHQGVETTWTRGERSGTWQSTWEKTGDGTAVIKDARRVKE